MESAQEMDISASCMDLLDDAKCTTSIALGHVVDICKTHDIAPTNEIVGQLVSAYMQEYSLSFMTAKINRLAKAVECIGYQLLEIENTMSMKT